MLFLVPDGHFGNLICIKIYIFQKNSSFLTDFDSYMPKKNSQHAIKKKFALIGMLLP